MSPSLLDFLWHIEHECDYLVQIMPHPATTETILLDHLHYPKTEVRLIYNTISQ